MKHTTDLCASIKTTPNSKSNTVSTLCKKRFGYKGINMVSKHTCKHEFGHQKIVLSQFECFWFYLC